MSDMLEKLMGVEKTAARLIAEAEAEAGRRTTQARLDAQKRHTELLKAKSAENAGALETERARIEAERAARNQSEKEKLSRLPSDEARFRTAILSLIEKGGE
jgi:hypothetical protein